jgi:hypothetical protein
MTDLGGGHFAVTATGMSVGQVTAYKIALEDWTANYPGSDGKTVADAAGKITFHFYDSGSWSDGWNPAASPRVGYDDPQQFGWDLPGSMNGWSGGAGWDLTDMGSGLYRGVFALNAGTHDFKFRKAGDWSIAIGDNFGNSAANNSVTVANNGDLWAFELDLPDGRWRTYQVPEPSTIALFGVALVGLVGLTRRRK